MKNLRCVLVQLDSHAHVQVFMQDGLQWANIGELTVRAEDLASLRSIIRSNGAQTVEWGDSRR
jgi:tRNA threonylcarbamoyladenosine modification (KEOPS) complex  Pcc1 subunit